MVKSRMGKHVLSYLLLCAALCGSAWAQAMNVPAYSSARVKQLANAIASAEGWGIKGTRPTRNNNPGDLREVPGKKLPGQVRIAKGEYIVFATPAAGFAALEAQLVRILEGRSAHYTLHTTINQMARTYAEVWRPWAKNVAKRLGVPGNTTLEQWLTNGDVDVPPQISFSSNTTAVPYLAQNAAW